VPMPDTVVDTNALMGGYIASPLAPRDLGGTLTITQQPATQTVEENHEAVFSVQVSNPSLAPLHYQWFRDGVEIVGAAGPTYRFPVTSADNNHTFRVRVAKVGSEVTSQNATLTVVPDTTGPHAIEAISASTNLFSIIVRFDELINPDDADEPFDFNLQGFGPPTSAVPGADGKSSIITYDAPLTSGTVYQLDVLDLRDLAGNPISPNPTTLTFTAGEGDLPRLAVSRDPGYVYVSWPAPSTGFVLEQSSSLGAPVWTTVSQTPVVSGGRNTVTITPGSGAEARFYRLRQ